MSQEVLTIEEAAERLGVKVASLYVTMSRGRLVPDATVERGNRRVIGFTMQAVEAYDRERKDPSRRGEDLSRPPRTRYEAMRRRAGLSRAEACEAIPVDDRQIYRYDAGEIEPPLWVIRRMVRVYNCTLEALIGLDDPDERGNQRANVHKSKPKRKRHAE
jgi:DNA-binding XRE family transcriptional regulator